MFDFTQFLKIICWVLAISCGILTATSVWYFHHLSTQAGKIEVLMMNLKGETVTFRWRFPLIFLLAVIALCCFH